MADRFFLTMDGYIRDKRTGREDSVEALEATDTNDQDWPQGLTSERFADLAETYYERPLPDCPPGC